MEIVAAHLAAALMSAVAWVTEREPMVFVLTRLVMPPLGFVTAWVGAALYNRVVRFTGGLEIDLA